MTYQAQAAARGFTVPIFATSDFHDLEGWARPDADYDGTFRMICADTGETLSVNGWLFIIEEQGV